MSGSMRRSFRWALPCMVALCVLAVAVLAAGCFKLDRSETPTPPLSEIRATRTVTSFEVFRGTYTDLHLPGMPTGTPPQMQQIHTFYRDGAWRDEISKASGPQDAVTIRNADSTTNWVAGQGWATRVTFPAGYVSKSLKLPPYTAGSLADLIPPPFTVNEAKLAGEATVAGRPAYVVELPPSPCAGLPPDLAGPQTLWFDRETLMILKQEQRSATDGRVTLRSEVTSVVYDLPLADDLFAPPPGMPVREIDATAQDQIVTTSRIPEHFVPAGSATPPPENRSSYIVVQSDVAVGGGALYGSGLSGGCATPTP